MKQYQNPYMHLFRAMRTYAPDKKLFCAMLVFSIVSKVIRLTEPYIFGRIINTLQLHGRDAQQEIFLLLGLFVITTFTARIFHGISRIREEKIKFQVGEACTHDLFYKTSSLSMERQSDNHSGKVIDKIQKAVNALKEFAGSNFMYLNTFVFSLGSLISLSAIRRPAGGIIIVLSGITIWIVQAFDLRLTQLIHVKNEKEHIVMSTLFDFLSNIKTVITLRFEHRALATLKQKVAAIYPVFRHYTVLNEWKWFSMDMLMSIVVCIIITSYLYQQFILGTTILIGTITMLWQYIEKMKMAFENFTRQRGELMQLSANFDTIDDIETAYQEQTVNESLHAWQDTTPIHIRHLHFSYKDQHKQTRVLHDISLNLHRGERIALVGSSGSGKSTLMMVLRGLYPVDSVQLQHGNHDTSSLDLLRHSASLIPQDPEIFEQSIRYNITMGLDVDDATIYTYTDRACFTEVLDRLPHGLDTDIKEKGVNLSGGQKQRLALARGLLMAANSPLLLLDESTSSVDVTNEKRIYHQIFNALPETCIIASIHKLHLLPLFDTLYIMHEGRIVESGRFDTLIHTPHSWFKQLRDDYQTTTKPT